MSETDAGNRPGGGTDGDRFRGIIGDVVAELPGVVYRCRNDFGWSLLAITPNIEELTGYAAEEFLAGEDLPFGDLIHPSDRDRVWEEVQEGLERDELFRIIYRIRTRSGEERWVLEEGRMGRSRKGEGGDVLTGYLQDVTGEEGDALVSSEIWHDADDGEFDSFREATDRGPRDPREDLPGRVLASGEPQWIQVSSSSPDPIRSGVAAPVLSGTRRLAVVELFTAEPRRRDPETERLLSQIGVQLGRVWERERATEERRSAQRRLRHRVPCPASTTANRGSSRPTPPRRGSSDGRGGSSWAGTRRRCTSTERHTSASRRRVAAL